MTREEFLALRQQIFSAIANKACTHASQNTAPTCRYCEAATDAVMLVVAPIAVEREALAVAVIRYGLQRVIS